MAALQLAALTLRQHPDPAAFVRAFSGSHRHMVAYLMDEGFRGPKRTGATAPIYLVWITVNGRS